MHPFELLMHRASAFEVYQGVYFCCTNCYCITAGKLKMTSFFKMLSLAGTQNFASPQANCMSFLRLMHIDKGITRLEGKAPLK
jgi:hypothetical protein